MKKVILIISGMILFNLEAKEITVTNNYDGKYSEISIRIYANKDDCVNYLPDKNSENISPNSRKTILINENAQFYKLNKGAMYSICLRLPTNGKITIPSKDIELSSDNMKL